MLLVYLKATKGRRISWEPNIHVFALEPTVTRKSLHEWQKHVNTEGPSGLLYFGFEVTVTSTIQCAALHLG